MFRINFRTFFSFWFCLVLGLTLLSTLLYSQFYKTPAEDQKLKEELRTPFARANFAELESIELKNRFGLFVISQDKTDGQWWLRSPQNMIANNKTVSEIFEALKNISISKMHENEPINFKSFALDQPILEIILRSSNEEKTIKMGVINPVDNSTYILISGQKDICQINGLQHPLHSLELNDFSQEVAEETAPTN